jgi:3-hydroxyisobutyrate dehydrogenase-like beta-hydroxyacid dehydrogenase
MSTRIGFIGTGHMGNPMATNLLKAGHPLTVCDVRRDAAASLLEAGAAWAGDPAALARTSDVVFLSLPTPHDVETVVCADDGVLAGAASGATIVDLSTNSPTVVRALAAEAAKRGVRFLDAPVSGGVVGAKRGTLVVMVGGDATTFEEHRPILAAIGDKIFHVGGVGAGNVAKLVNNMLAFLGMIGTMEALVLGAKAGIDPVVLRDVVKGGSGASMVWDAGSRAILKDRLAPTFTTALATKDIGLLTALARELDVPAPAAEWVETMLTGYRDGGFAAEDVFAVVRELEQRAGVVVRGRAPNL